MKNNNFFYRKDPIFDDFAPDEKQTKREYFEASGVSHLAQLGINSSAAVCLRTMVAATLTMASI